MPRIVPRSAPIRGRVTGLMLMIAVLVAAVAPNAPVDAQSTRTLPTGWNLVAAPESGALDDLLALRPGVRDVARWDPGARAFLTWSREVPSAFNTLQTVDAGDGLWVRVSFATAWPLPAVAPVTLSSGASGWVQVGWTGADASAAEVAQTLGASQLSGFDAATQTAQTYDAALPAVLNSLAAVRTGDAVWALLGRTAPTVDLVPAFAGREFGAVVDLAPYPGGRVFIVEQSGIVFLARDGVDEFTTLIDMRDQVTHQGERGLLSGALDPAFVSNGYLYLYYSPRGDETTRLSRFRVSGDVADVGSEIVLLEVPQPFSNHNGGAVRFGPDGLLYLGLGDGGSGGDPLGAGQDTSTVLGSIIRIDVRNATAQQPYTIPASNPFAQGGGAPEIYAYGFRNPWRMAFDPATGALWVGDVGQDALEEIDIVERGGNYGWNTLEGSACFSPSSGCSTAGTILPVAEYPHEFGCSVSGGVVSRGGPAALEGFYVYGDFCSGRIWAIDAAAPGTPVQIADAFDNIAGFGVGPDGAVYALEFGGPIERLEPR